MIFIDGSLAQRLRVGYRSHAIHDEAHVRQGRPSKYLFAETGQRYLIRLILFFVFFWTAIMQIVFSNPITVFHFISPNLE